jgi:hypothetical protein
MSLGVIQQSASAAASMALDLQISSLSPFQNEGILMPKESAVGAMHTKGELSFCRPSFLFYLTRFLNLF